MQALKWMVAAMAGAALAMGAWFAPLARASLVEALDLPALVERADEVALVRAIASESHFDDHGRIVTDTRMQVEKSEKGTRVPGSVMVVRRLGGAVGDLGMRVDGEAVFEVGDSVLLFANHVGGPEVLRTVGMSQGALRIREENGLRWVQSVPMGAALVKRSHDGKLTRSLPAISAPRRLDDVLSEVRSLIAKGKQ
jgi:hypothetical protein